MYLGRLVLSDFLVGKLDIWLRAFFWLSPVICVVMPFFAYLIGLCIYIFRFHRHISLVLPLICGYLLARFLPVPPTPEEMLFSWQRAKYEEIVELARTRQLQHSDKCRQPNQFTPPSGYIQWSNACIYLEQQNGMVVEFASRSLERPLVYVENPDGEISLFSICDSANSHEFLHEGFVFKQLDEHWLICKRLLDF